MLFLVSLLYYLAFFIRVDNADHYRQQNWKSVKAITIYTMKTITLRLRRHSSGCCRNSVTILKRAIAQISLIRLEGADVVALKFPNRDNSGMWLPFGE